MSHSAHNQQQLQQTNIYPQPPYIQYPQHMYNQQYYHNIYAITSTQQQLHNYHLQQMTIQSHENNNPTNSATINKQSSTNNSQPRNSHMHSLEQNCPQHIIKTRPKKHKHKGISLPLNTNPFVYLDTHDTISVKLMKELRKISKAYPSNTDLCTVDLSIQGICEIGNHLWLKEFRNKKKNRKKVIGFRKIKIRRIREWQEWIPKQSKFLIDSWKSKMCGQDSAESVLKNCVKTYQKRSLIHYAMKVEKSINKFRGRLLNFIHAVTKLNYEKKKHKKPPKGSKLWKLTQICWRCGKKKHQSKSCYSTHDVNGCYLSVNDTLYKFKPNDSIDYAQTEMLAHCSDCHYFHCKCNKSKRKLDECASDEPACKKQKMVDSATQIKMEPMDENENVTIKNENETIKNETVENDMHNVVISCSNCDIDLQDRDLYRCSQCKLAYYCNKECQSNDWNVHRIDCGKSVNVKMEKISVNDWNPFAIIYWFNRVTDNMFKHIKYKYLRKHIVMGQIKGCDLVSINRVTLCMMGINDGSEQENILNAISDVVVNNDFNNVLANRMKIDDIPIRFVDPVLYEVMDEPVKVMQSGYIYDKKFVSQYIERNKSDPITQKYADLSDVVPCEQLKIEIDVWKQKYLTPIA